MSAPTHANMLEQASKLKEEGNELFKKGDTQKVSAIEVADLVALFLHSGNRQVRSGVRLY